MAPEQPAADGYIEGESRTWAESCRRCGAEFAPTDIYCPACGESLDDDDEPRAPQDDLESAAAGGGPLPRLGYALMGLAAALALVVAAVARVVVWAWSRATL
jgi:hypothetical protein